MRRAYDDESVVRADLAAAFRWAAHLNFHEAVANHFSAVVGGTGTQFLLNPPGRHFSRMRASDSGAVLRLRYVSGARFMCPAN